jgi:hypothetical protein
MTGLRRDGKNISKKWKRIKTYKYTVYEQIEGRD